MQFGLCAGVQVGDFIDEKCSPSPGVRSVVCRILLPSQSFLVLIEHHLVEQTASANRGVELQERSVFSGIAAVDPSRERLFARAGLSAAYHRYAGPPSFFHRLW